MSWIRRAVSRERVLVTGVWLAAATLAAWHLARPMSGLDARVYWRAAQDMAHGLSPYNVRGFVYPPFAAIVIAPLGHMGLTSAKQAGSAVVLVAIVATTFLSARALGVRLRNWRFAAVAVAIVAGHVFFASTALGNVSALMALLLAGFYFALSRDRDMAAGLLLGLSLAIKPLLLPVLLVPILWARWRMLAAAFLSAGALTGVGALVVPHVDMFLSRALPHMFKAHPASYDPLNSTLSSIGHLTGLPSALVLVARSLVVIAAIVVVVRVRRSTPRLDVMTAVTVGSVLLLVQFTAGGLTEDHFLLTLIPLFVTFAAADRPVWAWLGWPALLAISGVVNAPAGWYGEGLRAQWSANTTVRLLGQVALLAAFLIGRRGYGRSSWSPTRSGLTSSPSAQLSSASLSVSHCAACSPGSAVARPQPRGPETSSSSACCTTSRSRS